MSGASDRIVDKRRRRGILQIVRDVQEVAERLQSLDWQAIEQQIGRAEEAFRVIDSSQRTLLRAIREAPLISPLELASIDRFVLENRCRALTNPVYLGDNTALCRVLGYYKMYLDTNDTGFASHLLLDGFWEMWLTIFFAKNIKPGMAVIDVGANFGYYTLLFGSLVGPQGRVFAVEPNPAAAAKLRRSVALNGITDRAIVIEAAAGNSDCTATLFVPHSEPKNSTIIAERQNAPPASAGTVYEVPLIRLDQLAETASRIDFIKIDAEGAEQQIINGMRGVLQRDHPNLLIEFNPRRYNDAAGFLELLMAAYERMRYIDFGANASEVKVEQILRDQSGEDWLLFFDSPSRTSASAT